MSNTGTIRAWLNGDKLRSRRLREQGSSLQENRVPPTKIK